jgi:hypothetical protein
MWLLTVSDEAMKRREINASFHSDREIVLEETASNFGNHRTNTKLFRFSSFAGRGVLLGRLKFRARPPWKLQAHRQQPSLRLSAMLPGSRSVFFPRS